MSHTPITVRARSGAYRVVVRRDILRTLPAALREAGISGTTLVVSSPRVWRAVGARLAGAPSPILVPDGERAKSLSTVARIYDALVDHRADRGVTIVAVGGGVIGDMVGFAAASYLRGVRLVHVPTTLMAQVDSAIGGKVGVNHSRGKNLIGAFHPPALVAIDPEALTTLPPREFRSGLYEVLKYGLIVDRTLLTVLEQHLDEILTRRGDALTDVVARCCKVKAVIVSADERESGRRRILNFGHTLGHALESSTGYGRLRHGEAVGCGMRAALALGVARGVTPRRLAERALAILDRLGPLPTVADLGIAATLSAVGHDKKIVHGRLHFVLVTKTGATTVDDVSRRELTAALRAIGLTG